MNDLADKTYHHGDLRVALLAAARSMVEDEGADAFTLREAARRAGFAPAPEILCFFRRPREPGGTCRA